MSFLLAYGPNAGPAFTSAATISGTLETGQTLTCSYTVVKARSRNVTCRWYSYFDAEGTDQVLIGTGDTYVLTGTEGGRYIRTIVTATSPAGTATSTSAMTAAIANAEPPAPPAITSAAVITGTAEVGQELTVTAGFDGETSVTYQWYSYATEPTGSPLVGTDEVPLGTDDTYTLTPAEADRWIVAVVTGTNAVGSAVTSDSVAMAGVDPYAPIAPAQYTVPAYDDSVFSGEDIIYANAGDDLQAKLNQLRHGKRLILEAGASWTGLYDVPWENLSAAGSDWAYITTSDMAGLPEEGVRVSASDATHMAKLQAPTTVSGGFTQPLAGYSDRATLRIESGVKRLRVVGLEITTTYTQTNNAEGHLVTLGNYGGANSSDIVLDRCYIHGTPTGKHRDGIIVYGGASSVAIKECRIDHFQGVATEAHGIHIPNSPGPVLIHNNAIIAAGINVFLRDNDTSQTVHPQDITITKNYIAKRLEWDENDASYAGVPVMVKNLIESKGSKRVLVRGNVFHHAWNKDQFGQVWFCQNVGGDGVWDIDVRDNLAVDCGIGINIANPFDNGRGYGWQRLRFHNNLFAKPRENAFGDGMPQVQIGDTGTGFGRYLTITNNTWRYYGGRDSGALVSFNAAGPSGIEHVRFLNNIGAQSTPSGIGVFGTGLSSGYSSAVSHMSDFDFNKNVSVGSSFNQYSTTYSDWRNWRSGNTGGIWSSLDVGYVGVPATSIGDFALSGSSPFKNWGTDGNDVGADISAIVAQINASDIPSFT